MENITDLVFENRDTLYKKVITLYTTLLTIKIVDVVDDVTNIKQDIEYEVMDSSVLEKSVYYTENLKIKLQDVFNKFGIEIDNNCTLDGYILLVEMINKLETLEKDNLEFIDQILLSDEQLEDKFVKLLDELYPLANNIQYLEYVDVSEYLFENIIRTIYENKQLVEVDVNTNMVNKLVKLLSIEPKVKNTYIFKAVIEGDLNIELSIDTDTDLVIKLITEQIELMGIDETDIEYVIINIFAMLVMYKGDSELSYYLLNSDINTYLNSYKDKQYIINEISTLLQKVEV